MFLEPLSRGHRSGWIEVITGSMFSGKTEELIRRMRRAQFANQNLIIYKPQKDIRYSKTKVVSHDENSLESMTVQDSSEILTVPRDVNVIGIDEAQFFDMDLPDVCEKLALSGIRVIVAGLDMDFLGRPFGPIPSIMAIAEYVTKVHAICPHCGNLATHSYRLSDETETVVLGEKDKYEPRCRVCYHMGNKLDFRANNGHIKKQNGKKE
ncbi:MAG TPA: thymidine kinase [Bacteroidetes bacterium]|nr:thymidine kinase [Bacteroidota bacterium]